MTVPRGFRRGSFDHGEFIHHAACAPRVADSSHLLGHDARRIDIITVASLRRRLSPISVSQARSSSDLDHVPRRLGVLGCTILWRCHGSTRCHDNVSTGVCNAHHVLLPPGRTDECGLGHQTVGCVHTRGRLGRYGLWHL